MTGSGRPAALFRLFAPIADRTEFSDVNDRLAACRRFVRAEIAARRQDPQPDLISHLLAYSAEHAGHPSDTEIADNALLVLADGIENIEVAIAQVAVMLARFPAWQDKIKDTSAQAGPFGLEVLRLESPAQLLPRVVREDHVLHGVAMAAGTPVSLALGSANRDPALHARPDVFDPTRDLSAVLVFGLGRHGCIGRPLAQRLITAATTALATFRMARTDVDDAALCYQTRPGHRWPRDVAVTVTAR